MVAHKSSQLSYERNMLNINGTTAYYYSGHKLANI